MAGLEPANLRPPRPALFLLSYIPSYGRGCGGATVGRGSPRAMVAIMLCDG
jgi:hypothetical protein